MFATAFSALGGVPVLAESSINWTPTTFYVAAAILQTGVIWLGFRLLELEAEYNTIVAAVAAAAVANVAAFFMKDMGVVGVVGTAAAYLGLLVLTSGVDILRSTLVFSLVMASYWGLGTYLVERTPLDPYTIGGPTKVMLTGGFEPEPLDSDGDGEADLVGD